MTEQAPEPSEAERFRRTTSITLRSYWQETISRGEALRRLEGRPLDSQRRVEIAEQIPDETQHYITFHGGAFREYVDFGRGRAYLLLLLPVEARGNTYIVSVPIYGRDRRGAQPVHRLFGIEQHEYVVGEKRELIENQQVRETFRLVEDRPIELQLDVSFVSADHPHNGCCGACEWVHSVLDIHCADPICCLGLCAEEVALP